ncbi:MAG TPA: radical SAM protein [bacterium]|nr:radical SAM protein [bacterium]
MGTVKQAKSMEDEFYCSFDKFRRIPRLPLKGGIDLTYRCNNNCRHCWLFQPDTQATRKKELSTTEWISVIEQARALGTREWAISGGEPMLREDFIDLFDAITKQSSFYSLNTNGTLITPEIARKLKNPGDIMVALYGATPEVNDHITRHAGSFELAMQGIAYLQEAGVTFTVQLVPMQDNFHQWQEMLNLAQRLSPHVRMGAAALTLSASGDPQKNAEIRAQRLTPDQVVLLDPPNIPYENRDRSKQICGFIDSSNAYLNCIRNRNEFHIDAQGGMSFCIMVKNKNLRYSIKLGTFAHGWEQFIPALAQATLVQNQILSACGTCALSDHCPICPAVQELENLDSTAKPDYFCQIEIKKEEYRREWKRHHQRFFQIAGLTIEFNSEKPIKPDTFGPALQPFFLDQPTAERIQIEHFFSLPQTTAEALGELVYQYPPWMIYRKGKSWIYAGFVGNGKQRRIHKVAIFNNDYSKARVYNSSDLAFQQGHLHALTLFATDQVWLAQALLPFQAFYLHSCGLIVDNRGLLFVGQSGAGKSTTAKLFGHQAELLCDDRNIVRLWPDRQWRVHGTWSHGELDRVSSASTSLAGLFFLQQAPENRLIPLKDKQEIYKHLIPRLVRPHITTAWWERILPLAFDLAASVPAYIMRFDKSGKIVPIIQELLRSTPANTTVASQGGSHVL